MQRNGVFEHPPALGDLALVPEARDQLLAAGRGQLICLLDGWESEQDEDLQPVVRRLAGALVAEMPGR